MIKLYGFAFCAQTVQPAVAVNENGVGGDHQEIDDVQNQDDIHAVQQLVGDTADIAK